MPNCGMETLLKQQETSLDLAHRHHLLPEVVLVLADRTLPSGQGFVFTNLNFFGDLVE